MQFADLHVLPRVVPPRVRLRYAAREYLFIIINLKKCYVIIWHCTECFNILKLAGQFDVSPLLRKRRVHSEYELPS